MPIIEVNFVSSEASEYQRLCQLLATCKSPAFKLIHHIEHDLDSLGQQGQKPLIVSLLNESERQQGLAFIKACLRHGWQQPVLALLPTRSPETELQLIKLGVDECIAADSLLPLELQHDLKRAMARRRNQKELSYLSTHDRLTGLVNRYMLVEHIERCIARCERHGCRFALMALDLDHFKRVNDSDGHEVGDSLLVEVASRLQQCLRESDLVARFSGDEFVLLLDDLNNEANMASAARKILALFDAPFHVNGHPLQLSASLGVATFPTNGQRSEALLKAADAALHRAKELGRNQFQFFSEALNQAVLRKMEIERYLHQAIRQCQFEIYYQPQVQARSQQVVGAEALLRWRHPNLGTVPPFEFIRLLEDLGLLTGVEQWVIHQVCADAAQWRQTWGDLNLSINVSGSHFKRGKLEETLRQALSDNDLPAACITIEFTEDILIEQSEQTRQQIERIREMGIGVALDDFGQGFSSLNYLRHFPASELKIDKCFIDEITKQDKDRAIVDSVIALAHQLGLSVVAEGVETTHQLRFLKAAACDLIQGYLFAKPMPRHEFGDFLARNQVIHAV